MEDHSLSACFSAREYFRFFSLETKRYEMEYEMEGEQTINHFIFFTVHWDKQFQNIFLCNAATNIENNYAEIF